MSVRIARSVEIGTFIENQIARRQSPSLSSTATRPYTLQGPSKARDPSGISWGFSPKVQRSEIARHVARGPKGG